MIFLPEIIIIFAQLKCEHAAKKDGIGGIAGQGGGCGMRKDGMKCSVGFPG